MIQPMNQVTELLPMKDIVCTQSTWSAGNWKEHITKFLWFRSKLNGDESSNSNHSVMHKLSEPVTDTLTSTIVRDYNAET